MKKNRDKILKVFWNKFNKDMMKMFFDNIKPCIDKLEEEMRKDEEWILKEKCNKYMIDGVDVFILDDLKGVYFYIDGKFYAKLFPTKVELNKIIDLVKRSIKNIKK